MAEHPSIYNTVEIQKDGTVVDFRLATASITFYEDILAPAVTCKIEVADTGSSLVFKGDSTATSLYDGLKVRCGELVRVSIAPNSKNTSGIDLISKPLYVNSVRDVLRDKNKEFFTLNLTTRPGFENEYQGVVGLYPKDARVSDHVQSIIGDKFPSYANNVDIDQTANTLGFHGNSRKPFQVLIDLASKSTDSTSITKSSGYLFFQTLEGFKFKSVNGLMSQEPKFSYTYSEAKPETGTVNEFVILKANIIKNQDLISNMRKGAFAVEKKFFDPITFSVSSNVSGGRYSGKDYLNKEGYENLGNIVKESDIKLDDSPVSLTELPTKTITAVRDYGTTDRGVTQEVSKDIEQFAAQRNIRYNTLFSQILEVVVPSNTNIHAGDIIECIFPKMTSNDRSDLDYEQNSGPYMVKEVAHRFTSRGSYTAMKLIRDGFGL